MLGWFRRLRVRRLVNRAFLAADRGSDEEAIGLLEQALEIDPHNAHANSEMSFCLTRTEKLEQAIPFARKAVAREPNNPRFRNGLIAIQLEVIKRLRTKKAVREAAAVVLDDIQQLIEQHPDYPPAYLAKAQTLALSGVPREQWEAALAEGAQAYERSSRMASGLRAAGSRRQEVASQEAQTCLALAKHWASLPAVTEKERGDVAQARMPSMPAGQKVAQTRDTAMAMPRIPREGKPVAEGDVTVREPPDEGKRATPLDISQGPSRAGGSPKPEGRRPLTKLDAGTVHSAAVTHEEGFGRKPLYDENVQFTVYRPKAVVPERWYPMLAFAHLSERPPGAPPEEPDPMEEVERQARQILGNQVKQYQDVSQDGNRAVPREGQLSFVPDVQGVEFNPPSRAFLWQEPVHREEFRLRASSLLDDQTARGRLSVFLGSQLIADVSLAIRVSASAPATVDWSLLQAENATRYRRIFASYSHKDTGVLKEVSRYATALGDEYLIDALTLRSGEVFSDRLAELIYQADVFQLFWSSNSMRSPFVRQEWEYALGLNRSFFIRPTYWEEPMPEDRSADLPPPRLKRLHFQRIPTAMGMGAETSASTVAGSSPIAADAPRRASEPVSEIEQLRMELRKSQAEEARIRAELDSLRRQKSEHAAIGEDLERQLAPARHIQSRLMPSSPGPVSGQDVAVWFQQAFWIGGDCVDVWSLKGGNLAFYMVDTSGRGLAAEAAAAYIAGTLRSALELAPLSEAMANLRESLQRTFPAEMFACLFVGVLCPATGNLEYVNAGHAPPLLLAPDVGVKVLEGAGNPPIGAGESPLLVTRQTIAAGYGLVLVSDGVIDATSPEGEPFGLQRLQEQLTGWQGHSAEQISAMIREGVHWFHKDRPQEDDMTALVLIRPKDKR